MVLPDDTRLDPDRFEASEGSHTNPDGFRWDWITIGVIVMIALVLTLFIL